MKIVLIILVFWQYFGVSQLLKSTSDWPTDAHQVLRTFCTYRQFDIAPLNFRMARSQ